jgi:hypothetical protein
LIIDFNGSFKTGRKIYMEVFGYLPRVHLLFNNNTDNPYDNLTCEINEKDNILDINGDYFERLNIDTIGTLIGMKNEFIRENINDNIDDAKIFNETILKFCNYYQSFILPNLIINFCKNIDFENYRINNY